MQEVLQIVQKLRSLSGNAQIDFLKQHKDNILLKEVLFYTYNPNKMYKIDECKYDKFNTGGTHQLGLTISFWRKFIEMLDTLVNQKGVTDEDVCKIRYYMETFLPEYTEFLKQVLFKDLRLNMGIKKFQKVWSDFCTAPQVQLAKMYEGQCFKNGYYSRKLDGVRCYVKNGVMYTRTNKPQKIDPIKHIVEQIKEIPDNEKFVFDGELIYIESNYGTLCEDFKKTVSLVRSDDKKDECNNIYFVIFDIIPLECFENKIPYVSFEEEYKILLDKFNSKTECTSWYTTEFKNILVIRQVNTPEEINDLQDKCKKFNWEGLMYRNGEAPYEYKRTKNLLKMKEMKDIELKLVRVESGTGKYHDFLGAFYVEYKDNLVKVGSGFTEEQRKEYWINAHKYLNKYVKVKYFEESCDKEGKLSLRFPVFMCFRDQETGEEFFEVE